MSGYSVYADATGEVVAVGVCADGFEPSFAGPGQSVLVDALLDPATQYVLSGAPASRPSVPTTVDVTEIQADGFDAATITGIPIGWNYEVSNGASGVTDGTDVVLTALEPGAFTIKFTNWPYQDIEYTINASATPL